MIVLAVSVVAGKGPAGETVGSFGGLKFQLVEDRAGERFPIPTDRKTQVDFRSTLLVLFDEVPAPKETAPASPAWEGVEGLLNVLNELFEERARLNVESVDIDDQDSVKSFQSRLKEHTIKAVNIYEEIEGYAANFGVSAEDLEDIVRGTTDKLGYKRAKPYENLATFLKWEIERLRSQAQSFVEEKGAYEVTVIAIHQPIGGQAQAIHVDPYDNLPDGQLQPTGPLGEYGIRMTPEELRRFHMEVEMNGLAADAIREIMHNRDKIRSGLRQFRDQLIAKLEEMAEMFEVKGLLRQTLADSIEQLENLAQDPNTAANIKTASIKLRETLEAIENDLNAVADLIKRAKELRNQLIRGGTTDLFEVVAGEGGIINKLDGLAADLNNLQILKKSQVYLNAIKENAAVVGDQIVKEAAVSQIRAYLETLASDLPKTVDALRAVYDYMKYVAPVGKAADTLDGMERDGIYYGIENPPNGTIDLNSYPLNRKEQITVKMQFRSKDPSGAEKIEHRESYRLEVEKLNLHTSVSASLIFARASSGEDEAKRWKPNVAAMVNWHYRHRGPDGELEKIWNWLNPGAGVHLASLDQGDG
jgi:uncharacterized protein (UPF0147 family)